MVTRKRLNIVLDLARATITSMHICDSKLLKEEDSFDVFISSTQIRYCYYSETQNILGNSYGMVILQVSFFVTYSFDIPLVVRISKLLLLTLWLVLSKLWREEDL